MSPPAADAPAAAARCVVLHAQGCPPRALLDALRRRSVDPALCGDIYAAMLALCAAQRERRERDPAPALVIVEPSALRPELLRELLEAAPRHVERVVVWAYDESARPPLRAFDAQQAMPAIVQPPPDAPARPAPAGARLRLVSNGESNGHAGSHARTQPPAETPRDLTPNKEAPPSEGASLLSEDELEMLLRDDEPARKGRRRR